TRLSRVPWTAVAVFITVSFGLAWIVALPLWLDDGAGAAVDGVWMTVTGAVMMYTPTLAVLVVVFVCKVPRTQRLRFLGMWPLRPAKRVVWFTVAAVFTPTIIVIFVTVIASLLGLASLDFQTFSGYQQMLREQGSALDSSGPVPQLSVGFLVTVQLVLIPFA